MENTIKPALQAWTSGRVSGFYGKELLNLNNGTVKLVKVDPHAKYPEHIHPDKTEYAFVLEGNPELFIEGSHYSGQPGEFFIFFFFFYYAIQNNTPSECTLLIGAITV